MSRWTSPEEITVALRPGQSEKHFIGNLCEITGALRDKAEALRDGYDALYDALQAREAHLASKRSKDGEVL